jgi:hypothetical protein
MNNNRKASSQVAWSLLTEGVTDARLNVHRIRLLAQRALALVEQSVARDHLYQVAGDLIVALPEALDDAEIALDRTSYALTVMGKDFLRGRLPFTDRYIVDQAVKASPFAVPKREKESMDVRVARRFLEAQRTPRPAAPSAEGEFFDNPEKREVRQFAQVGAISNLPATAGRAIKDFESPDMTVTEATQEAKMAPPPPNKIDRKPGGKQFSTLNRFIVETDQPKVRGVPKGREDIPKAKKINPV